MVKEVMAEGFMAAVGVVVTAMEMADRDADAVDPPSVPGRQTAAFPTSRWKGEKNTPEPLAKCLTANRSGSSPPKSI